MNEITKLVHFSLDAHYTHVGAGRAISRERYNLGDERYDAYGRERNVGSYSVREERIINDGFSRKLTFHCFLISNSFQLCF